MEYPRCWKDYHLFALTWPAVKFAHETLALNLYSTLHPKRQNPLDHHSSPLTLSLIVCFVGMNCRDVHEVRSIHCKEYIKKTAKCRNDEWGHTVRTQIDFFFFLT